MHITGTLPASLASMTSLKFLGLFTMSVNLYNTSLSGATLIHRFFLYCTNATQYVDRCGCDLQVQSLKCMLGWKHSFCSDKVFFAAKSTILLHLSFVRAQWLDSQLNITSCVYGSRYEKALVQRTEIVSDILDAKTKTR